MWNLQSCNKLIQQRSQQKSYEIHRKRLEEMQPRMRIQEPYQPDFVYTKNKLNMARKDRRIEIDRLNQILLSKMQEIKDEDYPQNKLRPQAQHLKTLNAHTMEVMNEHIATENQRICRKLMKARSFYPTNHIVEETNHLDYIANNISFNARRTQSARNLLSARSRPKTSYSTHFSTVKKTSKQNLGGNYEPISKQFRSQRPQTAPMFTRSKSQKIVVPKSGRVRLQNNRQYETKIEEKISD